MSQAKKPLVQFSSAVANPDFPQVTDVMPHELFEKTSTVHVIDVRRPDEYKGELGHIAGSQLIVLDTIPEHVDRLPKDETIVFVCRSGARSTQAAAFCLENGFQHVFNMKGGMLHWNSLGLEVNR